MSERTSRAAARLLEARRAGILLEALEPDEQPHDLSGGYEIQEAVTAQWPDKIAGWKVGATSKEIQSLFGISEPIYGPVFEKCVFDSPSRVSATVFQHRMLESEFTFRFGAELPSRSAPYSRSEIIEAVDALMPSFEIVNPRFTSLTIKNIPQLVADFCANGGAVLGRPIDDWHSLDLSSQTASLSIGEVERQRGAGSLVLGNPLNVLEWFVNTFSREGKSIKAGQLVMTGTMTGIHAPARDLSAKCQFHGLGTVEVAFV